MDAPWIPPLASAAGIFVALQVPYLLLRKQFPRLIDRLRYQLLALAVAAIAFFLFGGEEIGYPRAFAIVAFAGAILVVDLLYRLVDRFVLARQRDDRGRQAIPQLVRDLGLWILVALTVVLAGREFLGWDISKLTIQSAVLSAVLGFALQDVLKNVFAGMALQMEQPFDTGDWLEVDAEPRQVMGMTWRSTHLRNSLGIDFREPNANLVASRIKNLGSGIEPSGFAVFVTVERSAPPRRVKETIESGVRTCAGVVAQPPPQALASSFSENGVVYEVRYWTRDVHALTRLRDEVVSRIWYHLQREGFRIPFPVRRVELEPTSKIAADRASWRTRRAAELLARIDLFAPLPAEVRQRLAEGAKLRYYDNGERLVAEGETGDSLFVLARGRVMVTKSGTAIGATSVSLALLREGQCFGEMSLLTGEPRSATITAEGAVEVFVLDRSALAPILEQDPGLAETLSKLLAERVAATAARFEDREEELRRTREHSQDTILQRIRSFFKLGSR
jgi:small-conductance mechanosensitive channel/CRP-like cAMP-binding protein